MNQRAPIFYRLTLSILILIASIFSLQTVSVAEERSTAKSKSLRCYEIEQEGTKGFTVVNAQTIGSADLTNGPLYFDGIDLSSIDLTKANLRNAKFNNIVLAAKELSGADLSGVVWLKGKVEGNSLKGAKLSGAYFCGTDLTNADLSGADATGAVFIDSILAGAKLIETKLTAAWIENTDVSNADFSKSNFDHAYYLCDMSIVHSGGCVPAAPNFNDASLRGAKLFGMQSGSWADEDQSQSSGSFVNADLEGATIETLALDPLEKAQFNNISLTSTLSGAEAAFSRTEIELVRKYNPFSRTGYQQWTKSLAPSFPCDSKDPQEKVVCANSSLAVKDLLLAELFKELKEKLQGAQNEKFVAEQKKWLSKMRSQVKSESDESNHYRIVSEAYDQRINELINFRAKNKLEPLLVEGRYQPIPETFWKPAEKVSEELQLRVDALLNLASSEDDIKVVKEGADFSLEGFSLGGNGHTCTLDKDKLLKAKRWGYQTGSSVEEPKEGDDLELRVTAIPPFLKVTNGRQFCGARAGWDYAYRLK